jgi:hypothetical protein
VIRRPAIADFTCPPDKPVIPIVPSHIAKQRGHFGNKIKPITEPPVAVQANNLLSVFTQFMYVPPLRLNTRGLMQEEHIIERPDTYRLT